MGKEDTGHNWEDEKARKRLLHLLLGWGNQHFSTPFLDLKRQEIQPVLSVCQQCQGRDLSGLYWDSGLQTEDMFETYPGRNTELKICTNYQAKSKQLQESSAQSTLEAAVKEPKSHHRAHIWRTVFSLENIPLPKFGTAAVDLLVWSHVTTVL